MGTAGWVWCGRSTPVVLYFVLIASFKDEVKLTRPKKHMDSGRFSNFGPKASEQGF